MPDAPHTDAIGVATLIAKGRVRVQVRAEAPAGDDFPQVLGDLDEVVSLADFTAAGWTTSGALTTRSRVGSSVDILPEPDPAPAPSEGG